MNNKEIGNRIRKQREHLGYTREEFAEKLNISAKFCADIELGNKGMSLETLCNISNELLLTTDYILFGATGNTIDDETINLIKKCAADKLVYLKNIIRNFVKACY